MEFLFLSDLDSYDPSEAVPSKREIPMRTAATGLFFLSFEMPVDDCSSHRESLNSSRSLFPSGRSFFSLIL